MACSLRRRIRLSFRRLLKIPVLSIPDLPFSPLEQMHLMSLAAPFACVEIAVLPAALGTHSTTVYALLFAVLL